MSAALTPERHFALHLEGAVFHLLKLLRVASEQAGRPFGEVLERHPYLAEALSEIAARAPEDASWEEGALWWRRRVEAFEATADPGRASRLPLAELDRALALGFRGRLALVGAGLVEEDSRFGDLFAELQAPLAHRRPTCELLGRLAAEHPGPRAGDGWRTCRPLVEAGLLEVLDPEVPRSEWRVRVPHALWSALRGERPAGPPGVRLLPAGSFPPIPELLHPPETLARLERLAPLLGPAAPEPGAATVPLIVVRCDPGADAVEVLGSLAAAAGRDLLLVESPDRLPPPELRRLGSLATLAGALPALRYESAPGETVEPPELTGYAGTLGLVLGLEGGLSDRAAQGSVTLTLPFPDADLRRRHWLRALSGRPAEDLEALAERYQLSGLYLRRLAATAVHNAALEGREAVSLDDVRGASTVLARHLLDQLADGLEIGGSWDNLVVGPATAQGMERLERRCRHRERVLERLGPAFRHGANRGVRALFTGPSGTGKTLAARILASRLGMDLYRVDLAAVVNKYIGETEKNLHRVLSRAEALDVVLLLDEGDALLGGRTEVKSANDRYANLETDYLLQRLEHYQGILLVTTNLGDNIDRAFRRRMDAVVPFLTPGAEERWRILQIHLPDDHGVDEALVQRVAGRCQLTGGQLRNAALQASLLALDDGGRVIDDHLVAALRGEYRKAGGVFPLSRGDGDGGRPERTDQGLEAFIAALSTA